MLKFKLGDKVRLKKGHGSELKRKDGVFIINIIDTYDKKFPYGVSKVEKTWHCINQYEGYMYDSETDWDWLKEKYLEPAYAIRKRKTV